jgi:hypothetical protein
MKITRSSRVKNVPHFGFGLCALCFCLCFISAVAPSYADVIYSNPSAWTSALGSATTVTIPSPPSSPYYLSFGDNGSVTYSGVVFSANSTLGNGNFYDIGQGFSGLPAVLTAQKGSVGEDNILISFPYAVLGFSLDYGTFDGFPVTFTLSNGDTFTQTNLGQLDYTVPNFVGVTDTAFTSVLVTSIDLDLDINNVSYGPNPTTPEPASFALVGFGLIGFSWWLNQRARKTPR